MSCPATTLVKQITGLRSYLPELPIQVRPLFYRFATSFNTTRRKSTHLPCSGFFVRLVLVFIPFGPFALLSSRKLRIVLSKCRAAAEVSKPV